MSADVELDSDLHESRRNPIDDPRKRREIHSATAMVRACGWVGTGLPEDRARGHDRRKSAVSGSMPDAALFC
jgi:hypothetical protein